MSTATKAQTVQIELPGRLSPVRSSFLYKCAGLLSSLAVLSLPFVYISLVLIAAALVVMHTKSNLSLLTHFAESGHADDFLSLNWRIFLYFAPIVSGIILVVFMLKPFFGRRSKTSRLSLSRDEEEALYSHIGLLCELLNSREPTQIEVVYDVNAMASFFNGWAGLFTGKLVLTIGLPLVRGLTISQFTGVLIHELGHFRQTFGMKLSYFTSQILTWFHVQIYSRDDFDSALADLSQSHGSVAIISVISVIFINLTRAILWVLYQTGLFVSNFSSRQLEYDADAAVISILGTDQFKDLVLQTEVLSDASKEAHYAINKIWKKGEYCINLPDLVVAISRHFSQEYYNQLNERIENEKQSLSNYHLTAKQRFNHADELALEAKIMDNREAPFLFSDFGQVSERISQQYYKMCGVRLADKKPLTPGQTIEAVYSTARS